MFSVMISASVPAVMTMSYSAACVMRMVPVEMFRMPAGTGSAADRSLPHRDRGPAGRGPRPRRAAAAGGRPARLAGHVGAGQLAQPRSGTGTGLPPPGAPFPIDALFLSYRPSLSPYPQCHGLQTVVVIRPLASSQGVLRDAHFTNAPHTDHALHVTRSDICSHWCPSCLAFVARIRLTSLPPGRAEVL